MNIYTQFLSAMLRSFNENGRTMNYNSVKQCYDNMPMRHTAIFTAVYM